MDLIDLCKHPEVKNMLDRMIKQSSLNAWIN